MKKKYPFPTESRYFLKKMCLDKNLIFSPWFLQKFFDPFYFIIFLNYSFKLTLSHILNPSGFSSCAVRHILRHVVLLDTPKIAQIMFKKTISNSFSMTCSDSMMVQGGMKSHSALAWVISRTCAVKPWHHPQTTLDTLPPPTHTHFASLLSHGSWQIVASRDVLWCFRQVNWSARHTREAAGKSVMAFPALSCILTSCR